MTDEAVQPAPHEMVEDSGGAHQSQWQLIRRRFQRHHLAVASMYVLCVLYFIAVFAEVIAPYRPYAPDQAHAYCPPQLPRFSFEHGLHTYAVTLHIDPVTFRKTYTEDRDDIVPLGFFVKGQAYKFWGLIPWDRHLLGANLEKYTPPARVAQQASSAPTGPAASDAATQLAAEDVAAAAVATPAPHPTFYMLGTDQYGSGILSRIIYGSRISLSIGVVAIVVTFVLGLTIGGVSGYVGGATDNFIQRTIEIINAFPQLPLWLALGAVMPPDWGPVKAYFGITIVLSLLGWTGLARVVRGKLLSLREEDYAVAARLLGASHGRIIFRHLLPGFTSHIIVSLTMAVPGMILGETSLSFLGLGLRKPVVSWGVMLRECMNMQSVANYPWLLLPVVMIVLTVLSFNFLGDGLRDAADPYSAR